MTALASTPCLRFGRRLAIAVAVTALLASTVDGQRGKVFEQQVGVVTASCEKDPFRGHLICVVLSRRAPQFGFQFGSEHDSTSVGFSVGYRELPGTGADVRIDSL